METKGKGRDAENATARLFDININDNKRGRVFQAFFPFFWNFNANFFDAEPPISRRLASKDKRRAGGLADVRGTSIITLNVGEIWSVAPRFARTGETSMK